MSNADGAGDAKNAAAETAESDADFDAAQKKADRAQLEKNVENAKGKIEQAEADLDAAKEAHKAAVAELKEN